VTLLAWIGALAIGLTLGLLGAGGSILTVPVLVYLVGEPPKAAVAESLAIVGTIAAVGVVPYARKGLVSWHTVLLFSLPGMMGSYVGAIAGKHVSGDLQITAFGGLTLLAGLMMMRGPVQSRAREAPREPQSQSAIAALTEGLIVGAEGFIIGMATGFLGVGGGFLIVPALVLLVGLPMHLAIGTSLATIALNSASGFYKSAQLLPSLHLYLNWPVMLTFIIVGITGSLIGSAICHRLPQQRLRRMFGVAVLAMGLFLLFRHH
jgi:uncharacterized membrane protein YfcA